MAGIGSFEVLAAHPSRAPFMALEIDPARREHLNRELCRLFDDSFEQQISEFRSDQIVEFFLGALGPQVYNQAVQDARAFMMQKLDDLDGEVHQPDPVPNP